MLEIGTAGVPILKAKDGNSRSSPIDRERPEALVHRAVAGFICRGFIVAGRVVDPEGSLGAAVGVAGGGLAVCTAHRTSFGTARTGVGCDLALDRLGASTLRFDFVRGNRGRGRFTAATLSYEADDQSADLGVHSDADRTGDRDSVLGSTAFGASAGGRVCL